jgi:NADP-dependent 3-hydroxy acid dehydrogenase YdfG
MREHIGKEGAMLPQDVAEAILFVLSLPPRANVSQLMIRPTIDATPT